MGKPRELAESLGIAARTVAEAGQPLLTNVRDGLDRIGRQIVHERLKAVDPKHDMSSCYCCCTTCEENEDHV